MSFTDYLPPFFQAYVLLIWLYLERSRHLRIRANNAIAAVAAVVGLTCMLLLRYPELLLLGFYHFHRVTVYFPSRRVRLLDSPGLPPFVFGWACTFFDYDRFHEAISAILPLLRSGDRSVGTSRITDATNTVSVLLVSDDCDIIGTRLRTDPSVPLNLYSSRRFFELNQGRAERIVPLRNELLVIDLLSVELSDEILKMGHDRALAGLSTLYFFDPHHSRFARLVDKDLGLVVCPRRLFPALDRD